jgi:purine-nucleoside phosphorylase
MQHSAAEQIRALAQGHQPTVAFVMGSGWADAASGIGRTVAERATSELPGFHPPSAAGHVNRVRVLNRNDQYALVFLGRTHLYEDHGVPAVVHAVQVAAAAGCRTVVLTNAAGAVNPAYRIGQIVAGSDHLNLTGQSPLRGANFVDLTQAYSPRLRALVPQLAHGVYVGCRGPQFETPAEIRMAAILGGDLVGMSTVLETIAARAAGMEVLALSLVSNLAAGISAVPLSGDDVLAATRDAMPAMSALLGDLAGRLTAGGP